MLGFGDLDGKAPLVPELNPIHADVVLVAPSRVDLQCDVPTIGKLRYWYCRSSACVAFRRRNIRSCLFAQYLVILLYDLIDELGIDIRLSYPLLGLRLGWLLCLLRL
jgi:hypothetical protein